MENDTANTSAPERGRRRAQILRRCARGVVLLLSLPLAFAFIAGLMLIGRDISAPTWVKTRLETRAAAALEGGQIAFEDVTVNLGTDLHPRVQLNGVTLEDALGTQIARVDRLTGQLSPRGVVFERKALLQDVTLIGIDVDLARDADGALALKLGGGDADFAIAQDPEAVFEQFRAAFDVPALEALETVAISAFRLTYSDASTGTTWQGDDGAVQLRLTGEERRVDASVTLKTDTSVNNPTLTLSYAGKQKSKDASLSFAVDGLTGPELAQTSPRLAKLSGVDAPITLRATSAVDEAGQAAPVVLDLSIGQGVISVKNMAQPIALRSAELSATHNVGTQELRLEKMNWQSDLLSFTGRGTFTMTEGDAAIGQLTAQDLSLTMPEMFEGPLAFAEAALDLRIQTNPLRIDIGQLVFLDPEVSLYAAGRFQQQGQDWTAQLHYEASQMDRGTLLALWPTQRAPGLRRWVSNNLIDAQVSDVAGAMRFASGQKDNLTLGFGFEDAELRVFRDTPHITQANGYGSIAQGAFGLTLTKGHIPAAEGGRVNLAGSIIDVADMATRGSPLDIRLQGQGSITSVLSVLTGSPLRLMERANLPVDVADGRAMIDGLITFPRVNPVPKDDVRFSVGADLTRVSSARLIPNRTLRASNLRVETDNSGLQISGPAQLDGAPLRGTFAQVFGEPVRNLKAQIEISPETLTALDIDLPPGTVSGRGVGDLEVSLRPDVPPDFTLTSDLKGVRVAVPPVGWSKSPNASGALRVVGTLGARPEVTTLEVSGGGLAARGSVRLNDRGGLQAAQFTQLQIGDWFNAPLTLRGRGEGRPPAVEIAGGVLDLRRARFGVSQGESGPLELALDRMQVAEGIAFTNFRGSFSGSGGFNGTFGGNLNGGPLLQGTVVPQNGRSAVRLRSDDAGGIARAAGFLKGGTGGSLDLVLSPVGAEGTFDGALTVRGLRVRDAPAMAALLDAISVVGLLQQLDGQGLAFDEVDARFRLSPSQVVVTQASAVGPGLGISLDGIYALASKQLDFQGVVSPFFLLNGIGSVLTRKGEGLIGFNFTVTGDAAAPQVGVNPLSALTPGMFREIFRRAPPEVGQ